VRLVDRDFGAEFSYPVDRLHFPARDPPWECSMRGGFSLVLSEKEGRPAVAVKHLSQHAAMTRFTGTRPEESKAEIEDIDPAAPHESEERADVDRGYFVDVKTLAAALEIVTGSMAKFSPGGFVPWTFVTDQPRPARHGRMDIRNG
jgi:hypothetical protein